MRNAAVGGPTALTTIAGHALARYPEECCGLVVRRRPGAALNAIPCRNRAARPAVSFAIDPLDLKAVLTELDGAGGDVVAVYHSHPDGPTQLSPADRTLAAPDGRPWLPGAVQLIVSVADGVLQGARLWVWDRASDRFVSVSDRRISRLCRASAGR